MDPDSMSEANPGVGMNLVSGEWRASKSTMQVINPLNGEKFLTIPDTQADEIDDFVDNMANTPRYGLHNPLKNVERYIMLGEVMAKGAIELRKPENVEYFAKLIQGCLGKSMAQCTGEPTVVRKFMENYACDNVRFLGRSFRVPGDYQNQSTGGIRMPFGGVSVITPFNFPLEIPALQGLGAIFMGNRPTVKVDEKVQHVFEQYLRLLHFVGLPMDDCDMIYCRGPVMNDLVVRGNSRMCLFTGSQHIADKLTQDLNGRVKLEDAGFDWKIMGPDPDEVPYNVWQCDQDAYAFTGQKCSAQSMLFVHENWLTPEVDFVNKLAAQAAKRTLKDTTIGPILTWTNEAIQAHVDDICAIPGASLAFGGKAAAEPHSIPDCYGSYLPTAVNVPLDTLLDHPEHFNTATKELFGPLQVIVPYKEGEIDKVLRATNLMPNHLTAGIVSNDVQFVHHCLANTITGTQYAGIRAKTTAAPQQHWFGPSGDPRSAGIHTAEAIKLVWSSHREIVYDWGPVPNDWDGIQS